ncbi:hypothetical protein K3495_g14101, partial [Podosphaera aphanis]
MVDTGCLCYSVINETLVRKNKIKVIPTRPRTLHLADGKIGTTITKIARLKLDIDGRQQNLWSYVVPRLAYPLILGKPWLEYNDAVYLAKRRCLRFGSRQHGILVHASDYYENGAPLSIKSQVAHVSLAAASVTTGNVFAALANKAKSINGATIGAITMYDITQALKPKVTEPDEVVISKLPVEIRQHSGLFIDDKPGINHALPPHRKGVDTRINLKRDKQGKHHEIPWGPLYGMSRGELLVLRKTLSELLGKSWIRASSSPGGAPVLFTKKPGGGLRFCVDYRALNAITERDRYPLPLIRETLRLAAGARWFSKIDVRAAFHRLRISEGDEWKTAFRTRFGAYEWLVTPFGLAGAPAAFQRWINSVLGNLLGETCAAYLDDVLIFSSGDITDHWTKVNEVLHRFSSAGLKLDPKKCEFATTKTKYLGFVLDVNKGIMADPEKIRAITEWQRPVDVKGVRSFLGFANFYRNFIPNYAELSTPLHNLTKS